jgi:hypothetical protein
MISGGGSHPREAPGSRRRGFRPVRMLSRLGLICSSAVGIVLLPAATGGVHGDVPEKIYTYSVKHPTHGDIGTFRNSIRDDGTQISVRNEIQVLVKVLLVEAHKESSKNEELWKGGRLISFSGETQENGKKTVVTGEAEGSKFIVEAPSGSKVAPANVYPNNPWSKAILKASVLLGTKSGRLYNVHADPGEARTIEVGGRSVVTDYYRVDGDAKYELWFDERGIAVRFAEIAEHGKITFDLKDEKVRPASAVAPVGDTKG